jgi:hypothetical protein
VFLIFDVNTAKIVHYNVLPFDFALVLPKKINLIKPRNKDHFDIKYKYNNKYNKNSLKKISFLEQQLVSEF